MPFRPGILPPTCTEVHTPVERLLASWKAQCALPCWEGTYIFQGQCFFSGPCQVFFLFALVSCSPGVPSGRRAGTHGWSRLRSLDLGLRGRISATGAAIGGYQDEVTKLAHASFFLPPLVGRRALGVAGFSLSVSLYLCMCDFAFIFGLHELCFPAALNCKPSRSS